MKRPKNLVLASWAFLIQSAFLLSCEKKYITNVPEEHIPEYHMVFSYLANDLPDYDSNYVVTFNAITFEIIDSIGYTSEPYRDLIFLDGGNKALKFSSNEVYVEDVLTYDTIAFINSNLGNPIVSTGEKYLTHYSFEEGFAIYALPDLSLVDSVRNGSLLPIGIDDTNNIIYAFKRDTCLVYKIDFSVTPSETTIAEILYWRPNPDRTVSGFLSLDNKTLLLNSREGIDEDLFLEYDADSLKYRYEIDGRYLARPVWTSDKMCCFGISDGNVVKYNTQTHIYSIIINKDNVYSPGYHWEYGAGFYALDMQLIPNDRYLYIQLPPDCGGPCAGFGGHTLVYDINKQEFIYRYDYSDFSVIGQGLMRINPKDWSD